MTTAVICGGRSYGLVPPGLEPREHYELMARRERERLTQVLDAAVMRLGLDRIAVGDATGADALAAAWAEERAIPFTVFAADWAGLGNAAGPARNLRMLNETKPDFVIAFPGSKGTRNCCSLAEKAGIRVHRVDWNA